MHGFAITGGLGAGKTTVQRRLVSEFDFWTPRTLTTRSTEASETELEQISHGRFLRLAGSGDIVLPCYFGGIWYGWLRADIERLREGDGRAVLNVRPYTALLLGTLVSGVLPVWLLATNEEMTSRRRRRGELRDLAGMEERRAERDAEDSAYRELFRYRVRASPSVYDELLSLLPQP